MSCILSLPQWRGKLWQPLESACGRSGSSGERMLTARANESKLGTRVREPNHFTSDDRRQQMHNHFVEVCPRCGYSMTHRVFASSANHSGSWLLREFQQEPEASVAAVPLAPSHSLEPQASVKLRAVAAGHWWAVAAVVTGHWRESQASGCRRKLSQQYLSQLPVTGSVTSVCHRLCRGVGQSRRLDVT